VTGTDAGANFHSWAVWGSKKARVIVRQEDLFRCFHLDPSVLAPPYGEAQVRAIEAGLVPDGRL
jgi:hypothetical protein